MCLYETTSLNPAPVELECAEQHLAVAEPGATDLFTDTCNRMEADTEWLTAEPRAESILLMRYFSDQVNRIKDLLEYRDILAECLTALAGEGRDIRVISNLDYAPTEFDLEDCA